jgi:hypothetical protein
MKFIARQAVNETLPRLRLGRVNIGGWLILNLGLFAPIFAESEVCIRLGRRA